jgi:thiamine pyrophosphate-dependent acetolactate synthase large subunit-like protein
MPVAEADHGAARGGEGERMTRLDATRVLVRALGTDKTTPIVASLGNPAYDLFAAGDRHANFYTWGSMGLASSIGLGLAMARPDRRVVVLDGDGSLLMNLGSLATVGWTKPANLILIVWDNGSYATTGGQDTATAHGADLAAAAIAMGIHQSVTVRTESDLLDVFTRARTVDGPWMIAAKVEESPPTAKPPLDCVLIKHRFMASQS